MIISIAILAINAILCSIWAQSVDTFLISNAVIMAVMLYSILNGKEG